MRAKWNIGPDNGGFLYDLAQFVLPEDDRIEGSRLLWGDPVDGKAREILAVAEQEPDRDETAGSSERRAAEDWLRSLLSTGAALPANDVKAEAKAAGITLNALRRAADAIGVIRKKTGMAGGWTWALPVTAERWKASADAYRVASGGA